MSTDNYQNNLKDLVKGPSLGYTDNFPKRTMWREISEMYNGEFKIKHNSGNELEIHETTIKHKDWLIKISVSDTHPLKFEANFKTIQDFELFISWQGFIEKLLKWFGKKELTLDNREFDNFYLIESNKPHLVKDLITTDIQGILLKHKIYSVIFNCDKTENTAEFVSVIRRRAGTKESVIELIEMFKSLFDEMENLKIIK